MSLQGAAISGRRIAHIKKSTEIWDRLSTSERERICKVITGDQTLGTKKVWEDGGRSVIIRLEKPIDSVTAIKAKGVRPKKRKGCLSPHFGKGSDPMPIIATSEGSLTIGEVVFAPEGSTTSAENEFGIASILGKRYAYQDKAVLWGEYPNLLFNTNDTSRPCSFVLHGLSTFETISFSSLLYKLDEEYKGIDDDAERICTRIGRILKDFHKGEEPVAADDCATADGQIIHRYPHLGNFRINGCSLDPDSLTISDFDSSFLVHNMSPLHMAAWRYADIMRTLQAFVYLSESHSRRPLANTPITITIHPFLVGYGIEQSVINNIRLEEIQNLVYEDYLKIVKVPVFEVHKLSYTSNGTDKILEGLRASGYVGFMGIPSGCHNAAILPKFLSVDPEVFIGDLSLCGLPQETAKGAFNTLKKASVDFEYTGTLPLIIDGKPRNWLMESVMKMTGAIK
ncbi:hypothetical protein A2246_03785 [candidate division WOR-1 bacterium RIFOXYA2_FULL_37_7]|uniref:Uncharacterized protein n=1 Tax=candidate division WOR-1 bacterium RIFOXYB2_FULL_37_13 TaxID=1802579 RepID=A0A1F4SNW1_UNCSA|nr:MAG: hypothetical protein A2246_03785 [candidate division WOR-1 bacterium RIFOXYA2_FULL_37_7]OGC22047.1 MAG: hypothetical protein A2310_07100 [candidate division WOR-1 bacterium RIFOXYB2_FULL_37_13]